MGIILMIIVFIALVVIHERWHMTAAKQIGIKVKEFGIGIPPRITTIGKDSSRTIYSLNWIPLGWFVRMAWDNPQKKSSFTTPDSYLAATWRQKIVILSAGIVMNIITAWFIFTILLIVGTPPLTILPNDSVISTHLMPTMSEAQQNNTITIDRHAPAIVITTQPWSRADNHRIQSGSTITHINMSTVTASTLPEYINQCIQKPCSIQRKSPTHTTHEATYQCVDSCLLWVILDSHKTINPMQYHIRKAPQIAREEIIQQTRLTFISLWQLSQQIQSWSKEEKQQASSHLTGPVGIVGMWSTIIQSNQWAQWRILIGMISLALALFNLLPVPALDGGRIVGVLIQTIGNISRQKYYKIEGIINSIVILILLGFGIIVMAKDMTQFYCRDNSITQYIFGEHITCQK